jgi:hypothetical protein
MSGKDLLRYQTVAARVIDSIHRVWPPPAGQVRESTWWPKTIFDVYNDTTSGDTADYVYSRHLAESGRRKTYAFSLETGPNLFPNLKESFQPSDCESRQRIRTEIKAALLTLMEQTVCGIDHIGTVVLDRPQIVEAMAAMRDEGMAKTGLGREWLELFDRLQGPILSAVLADESLMNEAAGLFEAVASLIEDPSAKVTDDQIARGREFLRRLRKGMVPKLRRDLDAIDGRLAGMGRRTLGQVVGGLARRGPDRPSPTGKGSRQSENAKP